MREGDVNVLSHFSIRFDFVCQFSVRDVSSRVTQDLAQSSCRVALLNNGQTREKIFVCRCKLSPICTLRSVIDPSSQQVTESIPMDEFAANFARLRLTRVGILLLRRIDRAEPVFAFVVRVIHSEMETIALENNGQLSQVKQGLVQSNSRQK
jgi:hypothetical protein